MNSNTPSPREKTSFSSAPDLSSETLKQHTPHIPSYGLTHPKAYIGYTLAFKHANTVQDTADALTKNYIVNTPNKARVGALNLQLLKKSSDNQLSLTETGEQVCTHAEQTYGSLDEALHTFNTLRGTATRFCTLDSWNDISKAIITNDPAATHLINLLQKIHSERNDPPETGPTLPHLVHELYYEDVPFTIELLIRDNNHLRDQLVDAGVLNLSLLSNASAYRGAGVYQFKNILYHFGVLTERGRDTVSLTPDTDTWALEPDYRHTTFPEVTQ